MNEKKLIAREMNRATTVNNKSHENRFHKIRWILHR